MNLPAAEQRGIFGNYFLFAASCEELTPKEIRTKKLNHMGEPAYNLVIVKGAKEDLVKFEKTALKTESEAFCVKQLIPLDITL